MAACFSETMKFGDLNIVHDPTDEHTTIELVRQAVRLGYDTVAINIDVGDLTENLMADSKSTEAPPQKKAGKKKKSNKMKEIPPPYSVAESLLDLSIFEVESRIFRQYSRITANLTESGQVHNFLKHRTVRQYDIVAVRAATEQLFSTIASKAEVDLVCFTPGENAPWLFKGKLVMQAVERGVGFEISYGPALVDSSIRRQVFACGRQLIAATRGGRGVILSSGATKPIELRGPYDAANLLSLFGKGPEFGRQSISNNVKKVLLRADTKKTVKGAIRVIPVSEALPDEVKFLMKVPEFRTQIEFVPPKSAKRPAELQIEEETTKNEAKKQKVK